MERVRVVRMDHLRDMDGMWQSQVVVPRALRAIIGQASLIQTTRIKNNEPASRKKAGNSAIHRRLFADAKKKIETARAQLTGAPVEWPDRFADTPLTGITDLSTGQRIAVPYGARAVRHNGVIYIIEKPVASRPADTARAECEAVIQDWAKE